MKETPLTNQKFLTSAPLDRSTPFPEKGSLVDYYNHNLVYEDLIQTHLDMTGHIILNALNDCLPPGIPMEDLDLRFFTSISRTGWDRSLYWGIGSNERTMIDLGHLKLSTFSLVLKDELTFPDMAIMGIHALHVLDRLEAIEAKLAIFNTLKPLRTWRSARYEELLRSQAKYSSLRDLDKRRKEYILAFMDVYTTKGPEFLIGRLETYFKDKPLVETYREM